MRRRVDQLARLVNRVWRREVVQERHIDGWLDNLFAGMRRMTRTAGRSAPPRLLACAFWFFDMLCLWSTFLAFDYRSASAHLAVGYVVAYSIGTLAPTPGGLGAVEGILIALFVSFGVPSATAVAVVLVYRSSTSGCRSRPGSSPTRRAARPHAHHGGRGGGGGRRAPRELARAARPRRSGRARRVRGGRA